MARSVFFWWTVRTNVWQGQSKHTHTVKWTSFDIFSAFKGERERENIWVSWHVKISPLSIISPFDTDQSRGTLVNPTQPSSKKKKLFVNQNILFINNLAKCTQIPKTSLVFFFVLCVYRKVIFKLQQQQKNSRHHLNKGGGETTERLFCGWLLLLCVQMSSCHKKRLSSQVTVKYLRFSLKNFKIS